MKNKKQFLQISATAFATSLVTQILSVVILSMRLSLLIDPDFQTLTLLGVINSLVSFTIAPILIFAVFYFIGKKPNLIIELKPILSALLIGNIASLFIRSMLHSAAAMAMSVFYFSGVILGLIITSLPAFLLSALAGLSIGYIRRKKLTLIAEPELS